MSRVARIPLISKSSNPRKERGHGKGGKRELGGEREEGKKEGRESEWGSKERKKPENRGRKQRSKLRIIKMDGWVGLHIVQVVTQFCGELKKPILSYKTGLYYNWKGGSRKNSKPTCPFYQCPNVPFSSQNVCRYSKSYELKEQKSLVQLPFFLCVFEK